jgi:adhesin/invasin
VCLLAAACDRIALLAPAGSTISLIASASTLPLNGTTQILAQVIEPAGTPPHEGTRVTFVTTLGSVRPTEAETDEAGRVRVVFDAGDQSGTATITALSGGVNVGTEGAVRIAVGAAAVSNIAMSATPATISSGNQSTITAIVSDPAGNRIASVPVTFSTDNGSVNPAVIVTNAEGVATTTLTTTRTAVVTATAGIASTDGTTATPAPSAEITVTVEPLPTASIQASGNPQVGIATTFTITAQPGTGGTAGIADVFVTYGDGDSDSLGGASGTNIQVQHVYTSPGSKTATVTVTDTNGGKASASTVVVVGGSNVLSVNLSSSQSTNTTTMVTTVTFTATVTPASVAVTNYAWDFGDGTTANTTGNQVSHPYTAGSGVKVVTVTVTTTTAGQTGSSTITVVP